MPQRRQHSTYCRRESSSVLPESRPYFPKVGRSYGGGTVIYTDIDASQVTVVPTGYVDDYGEPLSYGDFDFSAYEKHGFNDYVKISPEEVTALMTNPVLIAKTGAPTNADIWTNITNIEGTEAQYWNHTTKAIASANVFVEKNAIPVRRVTVT